MMFRKAFIPYGGYYSTPFSKWQGSLQNENAERAGRRGHLGKLEYGQYV